jgi:hypothetical protein
VREDWNPSWPADRQRHYAAQREPVADEQGLVDVLPRITVHGMDIEREACGPPGAVQGSHGLCDGPLWTRGGAADGTEVKFRVFLSHSKTRWTKLTADELQTLTSLGLEGAAA